MAAIAHPQHQRPQARPLVAGTILVGGIAALAIILMISVASGAADIDLITVWKAIFAFDSTSTQHQVIRELRVPRALVSGMVGVCFAVSGAIMQGITRNPLASPGLAGVNAGSALVIAAAFAFFPRLPYHMLMIYSFIGALFGAVIVFGVASLARGGLTPVGLVLAGAAVTALFGSLTAAISLYFELTQDLMFWYAGGVAGTQWVHVKTLLPWGAAGLLGVLPLAPSITVLSLGEEVATGLGQRTGWVKAGGTAAVVVLTGAAVSTAGPIGFVGLMVPHITRYLVGVDYRWVIPCSAVLGALLVMVADIGSRMVRPPFETPIGLITAMIGVPFFLYLARREGRGI